MKKRTLFFLVLIPGAAVLAQEISGSASNKSAQAPRPSASPVAKPSSSGSNTASKGDDFGGDDFGGGGPGLNAGPGGLGGRGGFGGPGGFGGNRLGGRGGAGEPALDTTKYAVLNTRSIFSRDRTVAGGGFAGSANSPESSLAFRGAAVEDGRFVAFIEDVNRQSTQTVRVNDRIGLGRCTNITLDSMDYENNGETRQVQLGYSLAGTPAPAPVATTQPSGSPDGSSPGNPFGNWTRNRNFLPGGGAIPNLTPEQIEQFRQMRDQRRRGGGNGGSDRGSRRQRDSSQ